MDLAGSTNVTIPDEVGEIKALDRPLSAVRMTMQAVAVNAKRNKLEMVLFTQYFIKLLTLTPKNEQLEQSHTVQVNDVRKIDEFDYQVNRASKACGPLYKWIVSQLSYTSIFHKLSRCEEKCRL
ncbi:hypothetical protein PsorP6_014564 [Peronosclerospora sorghi]|uniref:Uncharacterized protein n=1 Tax=Peronosclerospora sorghi TaxID=230839 RepID=A0ACC0VS66_9STRA|nr:hypothetical protein PsorP6_014564 [Peronosclerospora sorghi]